MKHKYYKTLLNNVRMYLIICWHGYYEVAKNKIYTYIVYYAIFF